MVETIEFEPTDAGTTIHFRYGLPKVAKERAAVQALKPAYEQVFSVWLARLAELLATEVAQREAEAALEPGLPGPRADGILAGIGAPASGSSGVDPAP